MEEYDFRKDLNRDEQTVSRTQAKVFGECQYLGVDAIDYITKFMNSEVARELDIMKSGVYSAGSAPLKRYILQMIYPVKPLSETGIIDEDALYWVGYIYRYWAYLLGTPSREIVAKVPVEQALRCYPAYHSMGNKEAISKMIRTFS